MTNDAQFSAEPPAWQHRQAPAPPSGPYWQAQQPPVSAPVNGFAIAALVLGIVCLYWLGSLLAVIFGHVALHQIKTSGGGGKGLAIAGVVLGYVGLGLLAIAIVGAVITGVVSDPYV